MTDPAVTETGIEQGKALVRAIEVVFVGWWLESGRKHRRLDIGTFSDICVTKHVVRRTKIISSQLR
jgi:hypothetical protein